MPFFLKCEFPKSFYSETMDFAAGEWKGVGFREKEFTDADGSKKTFLVIGSIPKDSPVYGKVHLTWILWKIGDQEATPDLFKFMVGFFSSGCNLTFIVSLFCEKNFMTRFELSL